MRSLVFPFLLTATLARADKVDDLVREAMAKTKVPGVAIAVVKNGKVVRQQGYGLANVELRVPVTKDTVFRLASLSKQFTAASIMLLVEDGKMSLDDSVRKYLPDAPETWEPVKVRHLLSHSSGLTRSEELKPLPPESVSLDELLRLVYPLPLKRQPGVMGEYNNLGYMILGHIVGKVAGKPLAEFATERLLRRAGLTRSFYYSDGGLVPNRAAGYSLVDGKLENAPFTRYERQQGTGGVMMSVGDYARWNVLLDTDVPLSRSIREQMWVRQVRNVNDPSADAGYGFGWGVGLTEGRRVLSHTGGTPGFATVVGRLPDDRLTVVVFMNLYPARESIDLAKAIMAHYLK